MNSTPTPYQKVAALYLGKDVIIWIAERRHRGITWRKISAELADATNNEVDVTYETLRNWTKGKI